MSCAFKTYLVFLCHKRTVSAFIHKNLILMISILKIYIYQETKLIKLTIIV